MADVIVVGSGASAVHAACPLVDAGRTVTMIDVGVEDRGQAALIPALSFSDVRAIDPQQHRYFLGDDFSGVPLEAAGAGPQITFPRQHVIEHPRCAPRMRARGILALESFAAGGLAGAWGAVSFDYLDGELERSGLVPAEMRSHYETVAGRIGISAGQDDLSGLHGGVEATLPALDGDANAISVLEKYRRRRQLFNDHGVYVGHPMLAVLSKSLGNRAANPYRDMDYWSNEGESMYRPELTLRELCQRGNFEYARGWFVQSFSETADGTVTVRASAADGTHREFLGRRLILAAGALGTTRIVLRSLEQYDVSVPLVCNPHTYVPCVNLGRVGMRSSDRRHSLAQLTMIYDPSRDRAHLVQAQMYSYRSLLTFRVLEHWPLGQREGLRIVRDMMSSLVIWVIQHEDSPQQAAFCRLRRNGGEDSLELEYEPDAAIERLRRQRERVMMRWMRRCGCWPIRRIMTRPGSSIHYAGQLPMTSHDRPLTTRPSGQLRGTSGVFIADGSAFAYLPAKGLTFTLMANANRVGTVVAHSLA